MDSSWFSGRVYSTHAPMLVEDISPTVTESGSWPKLASLSSRR